MLTIYKRDDKIITLTLYDEDGNAINLTSCTLFLTVKQNADDLDAAAKISTTLTISTPATSGVATWTLVPADTQYLLGVYFIDIQLKDSAGKISTVMNDFVEIKQDITIRTT